MRLILLLVLTCLGLTACATESVVRTDMDRTADFARFRTFGFATRPGTDSADYASLLTQRLKRAVSSEMVARGYVEDEASPDLLIDFRARTQDKLRVTAVPPLSPFPYYDDGYPSRFYDPWPGYGGFADVQSYTEGTLGIDAIDQKRRQLVWQGVAVFRSLVDDSPLPEQDVAETVKRMFTDFPRSTAKP